MSGFVESEVEEAALEWFGLLGYDVRVGPDISPGGVTPERTTYAQVVLHDRFRSAIAAINPSVPAETREAALQALLRRQSPSVVEENRRHHAMLTNGVELAGRNAKGEVAYYRVVLIDFEHPDANDFLVVNQFTVHEGSSKRRPDVVIFINASRWW
jgi:type I restriction enzyme, R subunit